jgi:tRNA dimethylallyltransferase
MTREVETGFRERVEALVAAIPRGRVMTYGQLAGLCGNARAARIVGGIAHFGNPDLPWQRVVNKQGGLASGYPGGRSGHAQVLQAEGIEVKNERVDVSKLLWWPENVLSPQSRTKSFKTDDRRQTTSPLLVIVGPTASGKSALALELARHLNGEIICADSWTVRRKLNIGTAKPSIADQALVPHHLLDLAEPNEDFTAAVFKRLALSAIDDISSRGKLPIIVGGTGLYIDGVIYDFGFLPKGDRSARLALNELSVEALIRKINDLRLDLGDIDPRNKRRLIRLIETKGAKPTKRDLRPNSLLAGIKVDSAELNNQIEKRVDVMIANGLEMEVAGLAERYGWDCEGLKGVGYSQWHNYFQGEQTLEQTRQMIIKATKGLSKRQNTWFKRNKSIHWFTTPVNWQDIAELFTTQLSK